MLALPFNKKLRRVDPMFKTSNKAYQLVIPAGRGERKAAMVRSTSLEKIYAALLHLLVTKMETSKMDMRD